MRRKHHGRSRKTKTPNSLLRSYHDRRGQLLIVSVFLLALILALSVSIISLTAIVGKSTTAVSRQRVANEAAAAGIEKAIWCLNNDDQAAACGGTAGSSYTGETGVPLGPAAFTTTVTTVDTLTRDVESTGYYPDADNPLATQVIRARLGINTDEIAFNYALQTGFGGLEMENNSSITGNVYSNGDVEGGEQGSTISGDVWVAGGTQLTADQQSTATTTDQNVGSVSSNEDVAQSFVSSQNEVLNKVSLYLKKTGNPGNKTVRILTDNNNQPSTTELANGTLQSSQVTGTYGWVDVSMGTPPDLTAGTRYWIVIDSSSNSNHYYHWGLDGNDGYANGKGMKSSDWDDDPWTDAGGDLAFKTWMGGVVTRFREITVGGDAHANTLEDCDIVGDAFYQVIDDCEVGGTSNPGSSDPPTKDFPVSDAQIAEWKSDAQAGGTISGDYTLDDETGSLGPREITGNMLIDNGAILTVTGTIYVHGTVTIQNNATIELDTGYGTSSGIIVADGIITLLNGTIFQGAGSGSFLLLLTTSAANPAIDINNNAEGAVFYAADGVIDVDNGVRVTSLTADTIHIHPNAELIYDTGLGSAMFTSGPGGSWVLQKGTWREVK